MPTHVHLTMGGGVIFIMESIVYHESSRGMGQFQDEILSAHCQNEGIVFNVELETSFWDSRITSFLNCTKKI